MTLPAVKPKRVFTHDCIKKEADAGKDLIIIGSQVYDLTKFTRFHPGGQLAIKHQVGKDSTEVFNAFHPISVLEKRLPSYYVGEYLGSKLPADVIDTLPVFAGADDHDKPPVLIGINEEIRDAYMALNKKIREMGFYEPNFGFYAWRFALFACILSSAISLLIMFPSNTLITVISAFLLAFVWHGLSFSAHDAGHNSVSTDRKTDYLLGIFIADFVGGLSIGWWKFNHNIHHIVTNDPEHDPDIQHLPFFAVSARLFGNLYSSFYKRVMEFDRIAHFCVAIQHFLYYPVMTFGRFNLYAQSIAYLLRQDKDDRPPHRWLELFAMFGFWFWYGYLLVYCTIPTWPLRLLFVYISHASTFILHLQITLSHFAMSTETVDNESFVEKAIRTTMNVDCPEWFDWFHGGLQFQIEHHLFPRVPRCHFRKLQPLVKKFCDEYHLKYHSYTFLKGNFVVLNGLKHVADQVKFIVVSATPEKRFKTT